MKKYILFFLMLLSVQMVAAQGMSDQQVLQFIQKETKAGTSQSQIVTKLMQRGVKVDQIQRLRKQYADKMKNSSMGAAAEKAADDAEDRKCHSDADQYAPEQFFYCLFHLYVLPIIPGNV